MICRRRRRSVPRTAPTCEVPLPQLTHSNQPNELPAHCTQNRMHDCGELPTQPKPNELEVVVGPSPGDRDWKGRTRPVTLNSSNSPIGNRPPTTSTNNGKGRTAERTNPPTNQPRTEEPYRNPAFRQPTSLPNNPASTDSFCLGPPRCAAAPSRSGVRVRAGIPPTPQSQGLASSPNSLSPASPETHTRNNAHTHAPRANARVQEYPHMHTPTAKGRTRGCRCTHMKTLKHSASVPAQVEPVRTHSPSSQGSNPRSGS